ncbi:uncharacterized protein [Typha latifolia]|uniref:uncharacterized protein n=1 Tax=Typha latifolia TaxID=4733 RepID=UPI003C30DD7C
MDPWASVLDSVKDFAESSRRFVNGALRRHSDFRRDNPIEILKRLQREAFLDIMKLRDRQDKVERVLSLYKSGREGPFAERSTHIKGIINVGGALFFSPEQEDHGTLDGAEISTGISSRFMFETTVRQKDYLITELVANHSIYHPNDVIGIPLVLAKVMYVANISDYLSVISIPFGARCDDFQIDTNLAQGGYISGLSSFGPPLFNKSYISAAGLKVKASQFSASLAGLASVMGKQLDADSYRSVLSTFWQISCQLAEQSKLTVSGVWKTPFTFSQPLKLGNLVYSIGNLQSHSSPDSSVKASPAASRRTSDGIPVGSMAMVLEIDEDTKFGGWIEVQKSKRQLLKWAISLSDTPEDELGWAVSVGGRVDGQFNMVHLESFLNFNVGKKGNLQPGIVYMMEGRSHKPALVFRSSWLM